MIPELMTALSEKIELLTISMSMPAPSQAIVTPRVFIGALPPRDGVSQDFPFVIVRPVSGALSRTEIVCDVHLICGAYITTDIAADGIAMVHQLADVCLRLSAEPGPVGDKWVLDRQAINWDDGVSPQLSGPDMGSHPHPYYFVTVRVRYKRSWLDQV